MGTTTEIIVRVIRDAAAAEVGEYATQDAYRRMGTTADDIDDETVKALRTEAGAHGDTEMVDVCERWIAGER